MASARKRYPTKPQPDVSEKVLNIFAEVKEDNVEEKSSTEAVEEAPAFVEESIIPQPDPGPRFIDPETFPVKAVDTKKTGEPLEQSAKRKHPRNIPKFSRFK